MCVCVCVCVSVSVLFGFVSLGVHYRSQRVPFGQLEHVAGSGSINCKLLGALRHATLKAAGKRDNH